MNTYPKVEGSIFLKVFDKDGKYTVVGQENPLWHGTVVESLPQLLAKNLPRVIHLFDSFGLKFKVLPAETYTIVSGTYPVQVMSCEEDTWPIFRTAIEDKLLMPDMLNENEYGNSGTNNLQCDDPKFIDKMQKCRVTVLRDQLYRSVTRNHGMTLGNLSVEILESDEPDEDDPVLAIKVSTSVFEGCVEECAKFIESYDESPESCGKETTEFP